MNRSPKMQRFVDDFAKSVFGISNSEAVESQKCVCCGNIAVEFRNEISKREFGISGMCQDCQDGVFGVD